MRKKKDDLTIKDYHLTFTENSILAHREAYDGAQLDPRVIMEDWEVEIMREHARLVAGGDVLEIGFGMGISATALQAFGVNSHTIVEAHPQIAAKAREWAKQYNNITIIEGMWHEVMDQLQKYDGVLYDAELDPRRTQFHRTAIFNLIREGGTLTSFNPNYQRSLHYFTLGNEWKGPFSIPNTLDPQGPALEYWIPYKKFPGLAE